MHVNETETETVPQHQLFALSPLDGRYYPKTQKLRYYASEAGLIRYRLTTELLWLQHLLSHQPFVTSLGFSLDTAAVLRVTAQLLQSIDEPLIQLVKSHEAQTNHDVKACELALAQLFLQRGVDRKVVSLLHFGCTSEDINNVSYGLMLRDLLQQIVVPTMEQIIQALMGLSRQCRDAAMLSRTHGQTASPTTMGKELSVFVFRMQRILHALSNTVPLAKMNGAVGNYNAHRVAVAAVDWPELCREFIQDRCQLSFNPYTTQIESHDQLSQICNNLALFNTIGVDLCRDMWTYISLSYFKLRKVAQEVGSSTMPHKINPIDFENAEGNFGLSSALCQHFSQKLPISRLQRDLSDSTVLRSLGSIMGYFCIASDSLLKGMGKVSLDSARLNEDLEGSWETLTEAVQTVLRVYGVEDAYDQLKNLARGQKIGKVELATFIEQSPLPADVKQRLLSLTPQSYIGYGSELAQQAVEQIFHSDGAWR